MRGRPVLGAISGLFFGLFLALLLFQWKVWPLDALSVYGLPGLFLVVGIVVGLWAPFGRTRAHAAVAAAAAQQAAAEASEQTPAGGDATTDEPAESGGDEGEDEDEPAESDGGEDEPTA